MEVQGKVSAIMAEQVISEKFKKREFVIETGDTYPQSILVQLVQDKCYLADKLTIGGNVTAHVNLKGKKFTRQDGSDGYFNSIEVWKIDIANAPTEEPKKEAISDDNLPF